jgi:hypothetical protein
MTGETGPTPAELTISRPRSLATGRGHSLTRLRAVQITRFGGPEVLEIVDVQEPTPGPGQQLYDVSTAGLNFADTHHCVS